jgi:DNA-binding helix-hairpin-helix protein with protein kinase domain
MRGGLTAVSRRAAAILRAATAVVLAAAAWPGIASACPYCAGSREAGSAYFLSAVGMGLLPIGLGVGLVLWLRRRMRAAPPDDPAAGVESPTDDTPRR